MINLDMFLANLKSNPLSELPFDTLNLNHLNLFGPNSMLVFLIAWIELSLKSISCVFDLETGEAEPIGEASTILLLV
jgi:hypothetical protein